MAIKTVIVYSKEIVLMGSLKLNLRFLTIGLFGILCSCDPTPNNYTPPIIEPPEEWQITGDSLVYSVSRNAWYDYTLYGLTGTEFGGVIGITYSEIVLLDNYFKVETGLGEHISQELYQNLEVRTADSTIYSYNSTIQTDTSGYDEIVQLLHSNDSLYFHINHYDIQNDSLVISTHFKAVTKNFTELYNLLFN